MTTTKKPLKVRLPQDLLEKLHALHPGYGEAGQVVQELLTAYVEGRTRKLTEPHPAMWMRASTIEQVVKGRNA